MVFFEELGKKAQAVAGVAAEKAKDLAGVASEKAKSVSDSAKASMEIISEQREMEKNYRAIGEWFVSEYEGEVPDAVKDVVAAVIASKERIGELEAAKAAKLVIDNSGCSLNTAAGKKGAYRDLFYSETPLTQEVILAVCANEKSGIFGEQNWWFNARSYGLCWSLVRSFVHTYLKQDGTPFTAAADYAVKSFAEEMEGRDLRLEQTVRGRNFLWDGKTAVADIKNLSLTGYQVIKYTLDESKYDGGAKNINSIPLIRYAEVLLNYAEAQAELGVITDSEWALTVGALRKRAGITGGTETLPTTVDSYLQSTFYPDVTSPVLLEIRRERAIELVAEGMRFDDLRRWKCGSLMETLPWSGIPGTCWIWAQNMDMHEYATVLKVELEGEITYNLGHGEVVTNND